MKKKTISYPLLQACWNVAKFLTYIVLSCAITKWSLSDTGSTFYMTVNIIYYVSFVSTILLYFYVAKSIIDYFLTDKELRHNEPF